MAIGAADDQFDWKGPAAKLRRPSMLRYAKELFIPPKGHRVVPTPSGMLLIIVGLCLGLAAYNTENNILFAAFSLLLSALVLSGVICWANFVSARWRIATNSAFRVGEEGEIAVVVENAKKRFPLLCLFFDVDCMENDLETRLYLKGTLESGESESLGWSFKPNRRCVANIRIRDAVSLFPFGFLRKHVAGDSVCEVRIWPARISYQRFRGMPGGNAWQGKSTKKKGQTGELIGMREYVQGDALRSIHWKASAKQQRLVVREHSSESQSQYNLLIDPVNYLWTNEEIFERMCSLAASLAEDLFLESKLDRCSIAEGASMKINRVSDLEAFFDELSALKIEETASAQVGENAKEITFIPLDGQGVGAVVNGVKIAQA